MRLVQVLRRLRDCLRSSHGAVSIEYALIASLVSVAILGGVEALSGALSDLYDSVHNEVSSAAPSEKDED